MRDKVIFGGLALALLGPTALIVQKEHLLSSGRPVLLELTPVDPRSLMEGDYMTLDYAVARQRGWDNEGQPHDGNLVLTLDGNGVGTFVRFHEPGSVLGPNEFLLRYRQRGGRVRLGANAFFFQEGHANRYARAKYGELRVASNGSSVLVGLRDGDRVPLGDGAPEPEATVRDAANAPGSTVAP